ncbi:male abnormal protein mab-31-like [Physella acuta]|uniref:male abnormal protein mab-31-like n=1 Tax=Physella acuta TaxID=109671 RepID=UPI0027DCF7EE|nr:male abnormal protein mab-31-like [Physella acuta]
MDFTIWQLPVDEEAAIKFFQDKGIIHKERLCTNNHQMKLSLNTTGTKAPSWRCRKCRQKKGLRTNTWFDGSRIPFLTAVRFIYLWCQELTSVDFCELQLQMNHNSTVDWNKYMREICANALISRPKVKIGGSSKVVEIDEIIFPQGKNVERDLMPQNVFGGLCRETKECFLIVIPDCSVKTLMAAIVENVADESTISSDCWKAYETIELRDAGYEHFINNHKYNFVDPDSRCHSQTVDELWGSAKQRNKRQRGTARNQLGSYFVEFMWRSLYPKTEQFSAILKDIFNFMPAF